MDLKYYSIAAEVEDVHWWFRGRRMVLKSVLDNYSHIPKQSTDILEIGCGNGGNLKLLSDYGRIFAIELDAAARERAERRGIAQVEKGYLPDRLPFDNKMFDIIAAFDVIEHIDDDLKSIQAIHARLNPQGLVLLTVPAYNQLWSRHDELSHHKRRYHVVQITSIIERAGFKVLYKSYFNTLLFPLAAFNILLSKIFKRAPYFALKLPPSPINNIFTRIFSFESQILSKFSLPFGMSILVCAQRK